MRSGRWWALALGLAGCASSGGLTPPVVHMTEISFGVPDGEPLRTLPFAQTFAWVEPSALWLGTLPRDDQMGDRSFVIRLKEKAAISFRALDWREAPATEARYHVAILNAERTVRVATMRGPDLRAGRTDARRVAGEHLRDQVYRGIAIRRLSDGAVFWHLLWTGDQWNNEEILANLVAELAVGRAPIPEPTP